MNQSTLSKLGPEGLAELAETFGLLSDMTRLSIVLICRDGTKQSGQIAEELGVSPSLVSHHLRLLRAQRVVQAKREGRNMHYVLADDCVRDVLTLMVGHIAEHHGEADLSRADAPESKEE